MLTDEEGLKELQETSNAGIAKLKEQFGGASAKDNYALVAEGIKVCRSLRSKADKAKKELNENALAWQRTVNGEHKRIINAIKDIEDPLKDSKREVDEAEQRAKEEALRAMREKEERERREEEERLAREREELEAEKRELARQKEELEAKLREQQPEDDQPETKPPVDEPKATVSIPSGLPEGDELDRICTWMERIRDTAPEVESTNGIAFVTEILEVVRKQEERLQPAPKRVIKGF